MKGRIRMTVLAFRSLWLNSETMQETQVRSLGREDSPGGGRGNSLQYSCLENSMDREACMVG